MTVLGDLVAGYGLTVEEFTDRLQAELATDVAADPRGLSAHDRQVLASIGVTDDDLVSTTDPIAVAVDVLRDTHPTLTTEEAGAALDRSESRIRGAIADGSLYGVRVGRIWQLPAWQIHDGRPLPHLRKVIAAVPDAVSPTVLGRAMTMPTDELTLDGTATAPTDWLLSGGDAAPVVNLVAALLTW